MPSLKRGLPGAESGAPTRWIPVKSGSSSSNESGYARRKASCRAFAYSVPRDFQSKSSESRSVRFRWLIRCRRDLLVKASICDVFLVSSVKHSLDMNLPIG